MTDQEWKSMGRPPTFDGSEDGWADWAFVMRAYLLIISPEAAQILEAAERQTDIVAGNEISNARTFDVIVLAVKSEGAETMRQASVGEHFASGTSRTPRQGCIV